MKVRLPKLEAQEIGRPVYRVRNPVLEGKMYDYRQPMFDYYGVTVATALTRQRLFQIPQGQSYTPAGGAALVKASWHTNMDVAGSLPNPRKLFVKSISLMAAPDIAVADAVRFFHDVLVQFTISSREYTFLHGVKTPAQGGLFSASTLAVNNGLPQSNQDFAFWGELGEVIEQLQPFAVILDPTLVIRANAAGVFTTAAAAAGGTGINAHVYLDGRLQREVN